MKNKKVAGASSSKVQPEQREQDAPPTLVPELRFPEFENAGEWKTKSVGEIGKIVASGDLDLSLFSPTETHSHTYPVYANSVTQEGLYGYYSSPKYKKGSVTITARGTLGVAFVRNKDFAGIGRLLVVSEWNDSDPRFFKESWGFSKNMVIEDGGIPQLTAIKAKSVKLDIPSIAEQQKIADCLGSLDHLIAAHSRKLAALQDHKKGLLQQLFPAEGETTPKLRFPEFEGEARITSLGAIAKFGSGGTPAKNEPSYWNGEIPWISASSMHDPFVEDSELRVTPIAIGNGTRIAKKGTLLILVRGSMLFKRVPICLALCDVAFNQDVKSLIIEKGVNAYFLLSQLVSFESRIPINRTGIGAGKIDTDDLKSLELFIPSPAEQQRIADCLNTLDAIITNQTEQIAALQEHKKGLMQQLFPNPELSKV